MAGMTGSQPGLLSKGFWGRICHCGEWVFNSEWWRLRVGTHEPRTLLEKEGSLWAQTSATDLFKKGKKGS